MIKVAAHQPALLPWVGFWAKLHAVDLMLVMTDMPWDDSAYYNSVTLKGQKYSIQREPGHANQVMHTMVTSRSLNKFFRTLDQNAWTASAKNRDLARYFDGVRQEIPSYTITNLQTLNFRLLCIVRQALVDLGHKMGVLVPAHYHTDGVTKSERLRSYLTNCLGAQDLEYYSGAGGLNYLKADEMCMPVRVQQLPECSTDSVVQLIARTPEELTRVFAGQTWKTL